MPEALPELVQFQHSMYNEKARWAFDYKGVAHTRRSLLPGPHAPVVKKLTGRTETPVLLHDGQVVTGSAAIVDYVETRFPGPVLYPQNADEKARVLEWQRWLDDTVGPPARQAYFVDFLPDHAEAGRCFSWGKDGIAAALYRKSFPATHLLLKKIYALTPEHAERGRQLIGEALDRIAAESSATGYLVGDAFTAADLTAAGLLMFCAHPVEYHIPLQQPVPAGEQKFLDRWRDHPGTAWIHRMYREHRGRSAEVAAA